MHNKKSKMEIVATYVALTVVTLFFLLIILFFPEGFSRAALAAMGVAAVVLYLRYHTLHKYFRLILPAGGVVLIAGLSYALAVMDLPDTRFR